jgi:hypothetical protein
MVRVSARSGDPPIPRASDSNPQSRDSCGYRRPVNADPDPAASPRRLPLKAVQRLAALATAVVVVVAAHISWWPFDGAPRPIGAYAHPTVWQYLFADRLALGFARLAVAAFAVYAVASVPALVVAARWAKGFGTTGLATDDAAEASKTLQELTRQNDELTGKLGAATRTLEQTRGERDRALELLSSVVMPNEAPIIDEGGGDDDDQGAERPPRGADARGEGDR